MLCNEVRMFPDSLSVASGWQRFIEAFGIRPDSWTEAMPLPWHME
jgi:hypothetical protein